MKRLIFFASILAFNLVAVAQDKPVGNQFSAKLNGNAAQQKLVITNLMSGIIVKTHDKNELMVEADGYKGIPEKAKGLKPLSAIGEDNTDIGLYYKSDGNEISISGASRSSMEADYTFYIPAAMNILIESKGWENGDIEIEGISGEVEVKSNIGDVILKRVTGPLILWTLSSDIVIEYASLSQAGPHSISSTSGEIDITIPSESNGVFDLKTMSGDIYTDLDFSFPEKSGLQRVASGVSAKGTLNGGGVDFALKSISGNVYIRKK